MNNLIQPVIFSQWGRWSMISILLEYIIALYKVTYPSQKHGNTFKSLHMVMKKWANMYFKSQLAGEIILERSFINLIIRLVFMFHHIVWNLMCIKLRMWEKSKVALSFIPQVLTPSHLVSQIFPRISWGWIPLRSDQQLIALQIVDSIFLLVLKMFWFGLII